MKKRPDLKTTLHKKVPLSTPSKTTQELDQALEQLHTPKSKEVSNSDEAIVKTSVWLPKSLHRRVKVYCAGRDDMNLRAFIIQAIAEKIDDLQ